MFNSTKNGQQPKLFSRRKMLKQGLLVGAGLGTSAITAGTVLAGNPTPTSPSSKILDNSGIPAQLNLPVNQALPPAPPTPGTSYKMFAGQEFKPISSDTGYSGVNYSGIYANSDGFFFLGIDLLEGARITELEFYNLHNTSNTGLFSLEVTKPNVTQNYIAAGSDVNTQANNIQTIKVTIPANIQKIDQTSLKYFLIWHPGEASLNDILFGARLGYTGGIARFGA